MSYGIPPGSSSRSLKPLRKALLKEGEEEIQEGSLEEEEEGGACLFSDVTYLHTGAAKSRKSVTVSVSGEGVAAVGRISAETVRESCRLAVIK